MATYLQFVQVQTQTQKQKLEILRRREEREDREGQQRAELERLQFETQRNLDDAKQRSATTKQKSEQAIVSLCLYFPPSFRS